MDQKLAQALWCYDPETGVFVWRESPGGNIRAGDVAGSIDSEGYVQLGYGGKRYKAHRVGWVYSGRVLPTDFEIDHQDLDRGNNRLANLRLATRKQNAENTASRRAGGFRGVYWFAQTNKWVVLFKHHGKQKNLGYFGSLIDAVACRIAAEREHYTHSVFSK